MRKTPTTTTRATSVDASRITIPPTKTDPSNETTNANFADDTSHFSGRTTNHHPTDDGSPAVGTTTNGTTNANFADGTSHLGGRPMNHHPTDDGRPVATTDNVNFADGTTCLGGRPTNHHPIDDGRLVGTTNVNPTNLTITPPTNNGTTNIAPNYASLLTLLATNPTDPTIAAAFIEFLQQKHNINPNIIAPPTPTFTSTITDATTPNTTLTSPGTPSYSSVTTGHHFPTPKSTNDDEDIEEEDPILSQTDVLPLRPTPIKSAYICPSSGNITSALEEQRLAQTEDLCIQTHHATEKRVYNHQAATKRRCVIVKFAMATNATSDQAPLPSALEQVIDSIISNLAFNFYVDVVAIINYSTPVLNTRKNNSSYYSFIYVSPRSTQIPISNTYSKEFAIVHARLADLLKGPLQAITNIPDLPEITRHLVVCYLP